jgi:predicted Zn-dependent protease
VPESVAVLRIRATVRAADGALLRDATHWAAPAASGLPGDAELTRGATTLAQNLVALARAPKGEDYSGPVLFEGAAGAQIMAEVLGRNLGVARRPVMDAGRGGNMPPGELEGRIGARVLPESFDVLDDPGQKQWRGRPLFGSYEVDREAVPARPIRLVEKGVLKSYLLTRQPVRGFEGSNGRARLPGPFGAAAPSFGNLFVASSEAMPPADLKKKLIQLCEARNQPYGILVRKMDFPSTAPLEEARRTLTAAQGGRPVSMPVLVYRVYRDGREELVRGLRFRGLNARSLKDIVAAGDDASAFEYMENTAPFALVGAASFTTEVSVIAPSLLVDDLELHPVEDETPRLPVAPPPEMTR